MRIGRRSRSRSRNGSGSSSWALFAVVAIAVGLVVSGLVVAPSVAFTTGSVDRGTTAPVVDDAAGFLGIDVADSLQAGSDGRLVTVTNNLNRTLRVDVSASAALSNSRATLGPGESVTTKATIGCESPPSELSMTIAANTAGGFSALATRSASVETAGCTVSTPVFEYIEIRDDSKRGQGGPAVYTVEYSIEKTDAFDRIEVDFENLEKTESRSPSSHEPSGRIDFEKRGQRFGDPYEITVRVFSTTGEIESERIVVTETADGSGTVYRAP